MIIAEARAKSEARAKERFEREQAEHQAKLAARATDKLLGSPDSMAFQHT